MPPWIVKAAVQGMLSRMPDPQRWNRLFQRATGSLQLTDAWFETKLGRSRRHVQIFRSERGHDASFVALELGTGWFPIAPVGLALLGARRVYSVDLHDLLAHDRVLVTLQRFVHAIRAGSFEPADPKRLGQLEDVLLRASSLTAHQLLEEVGVHAMIADARELELDDDSVDLLVSNNTLEHIPGEVLEGILRELRRVATPDAVMSHYIDMADHYNNFDGRISVYNFLRFSERTWRLFNNDLQYQNRLRLPDFRRLHADAGWRVIEEDNEAEPPEVLASVKLAPEFRRYAEADLRVHKSWMVSRPASSDDDHARATA